jgi:hypothetical protein
MPGGWLDQPQNAPARRRLTAAGLPDEPEHFTFVDREAHIVHGANDRGGGEKTAFAAEVFDEVRDFEECHQAVLTSRTSGSTASE